MESSLGEEESTKTVFVNTNLDTRFVTTVSDSDTVYHLKKKVILDHHQCFPTIGVIKVDGLKVKRRGQFYHLSDSMILKSVLDANKNNWFISIDASCLEQDIGIQHVDQHTEENRLFKNEISSKKRTLDVQNDSLLHDATGSGPSVEKKRKIQDKEASVKASDDLNDEINRLYNGASCFVLDQVDPAVSYTVKIAGMETLGHKKTRASERLTRNALKYQEIREWILTRSSRVPASAIINRVRIPSTEKSISENTITHDVTTQEIERLKPTEVVEETSKKESEDAVINEEKLSPQSERKESQDDSHKDDTVTNNDAETNLSEGNDKGIDEQFKNANTLLDAARKDDSDERFGRNKGENCSDQVLTDVSMAVQEIVPQEIPSQISQKERDNELFQNTDIGNESMSSSIRTSDCEHDASALGHLIGAKCDLPEKDLRYAIQIDNHKEDGYDEQSEKKNENTDVDKRKKRKKKTRTSLMNGEVGMSSAVSDPALNEHENTLLNTANNDEVKGIDAQVSGERLMTGPGDLSSKRRATQLEFEPENSQSTDHQTSKVSKSKDDVPQRVKVKKTKEENKRTSSC